MFSICFKIETSVYESIILTEAYLELSRTYTMERFYENS